MELCKAPSRTLSPPQRPRMRRQALLQSMRLASLLAQEGRVGGARALSVVSGGRAPAGHLN